MTLKNPSRRLLATAAMAAAMALSGCAAMMSVTSEVSSFGQWPAGRAPGSFAFDRLPSQQARGAAQDQLEQMALQALQDAGFQQVADPASAEVLVQVGARIDRQERSPWEDPLWGHPWGPRWRASPWASPYWRDWAIRRPEFSREIALLIRDRASGAALFEARATNEGATEGSPRLIGAMFSAALREFPAVQSEPHRVSITLP